MTTCIANVAVGSWYPEGQKRLSRSIPAGITRRLYTDWPEGSPTHADAPYAFKFFAMREAQNLHDIVWYMDASCWLANSFTPMIHLAFLKSVVLFRNWNHLGGHWKLGQWCSDRVLDEMGYTRDQAMEMDLPVGGCIGLADSVLGVSFVNEMICTIQQKPHWFRGSWTNKNGECSSDPRCLGHRHDQCVLAYVAQWMGIPLLDKAAYFGYDDQDNTPPETIVRCRGPLSQLSHDSRKRSNRPSRTPTTAL